MTKSSAPQPEVGSLMFPERRRPGRVEFDNPDLIALLRRSTDEADDLATARRVGVAVATVALIWLGVALLTWWLTS